MYTDTYIHMFMNIECVDQTSEYT